MLNRVLKIAAWLCLAAIIVFTLGPLDLRPHLIDGDAGLDRFVGYVVLAVLFTWAYPRRLLTVGCLLAVAAVALELLQLETLDRHGHVIDVVIKLLGVVSGLQLGLLAHKLLNRMTGERRRLPPRHAPTRAGNESAPS
jgi:hypothetical protein